jgi:UDP-N-acetylmuramate dehydrogenase
MGELAGIETALEALVPLGKRVVPGGDLGPLTTYRVGGPAGILVTAGTVGDLQVVATALAASHLPVLVVGRGSNLLVSDEGFGGIAVVLDPAGFGEVVIDTETSAVQAGGAVPLPALARQTVEAGLTGFEWAVGVPGSVGGGVRMNAGGHGSDIAATLRSCRVSDLVDGDVRELLPADLQHGYRASSIGPSQVVIAATFDLAPGDIERGRATIREIVRWRRENQPGGQNSGSVFTNPPGDSAGRLIDTAGCKGWRRGTAMVSPKHANFIQADPGGSADDVLTLIDDVQAEVARRHGVELHPEVRLVGVRPDPKG